MTREEAAKMIKDDMRLHHDYLSGEYRKALNMAIKALEQPEQRWTPVTEGLPEAKEKHYWVCTDTGYQCQCRWTNINHFWTDLTTEWHWHIMDTPQYSKVVAWMPLPEPYGGEKDDSNKNIT